MTCSANAVNVILGVKWYVEVDNGVNALDINAAAHDVSLQQNLNAPLPESVSALARKPFTDGPRA